jgi:hypothetical protein
MRFINDVDVPVHGQLVHMCVCVYVCMYVCMYIYCAC